MTERSFGAERSIDDPVEALAPQGDETPGDYEISGPQSDDTGTIYDDLGETEATPHDLETLEAEDDE